MPILSLSEAVGHAAWSGGVTAWAPSLDKVAAGVQPLGRAQAVTGLFCCWTVLQAWLHSPAVLWARL